MVFLYLLSLIFNIYVVLYSPLFPFVYTLFTWLFLFCCASFSFPIKFYIYRSKKKTNEGANSAKSNPWLRCVCKDRRGEERKYEEWGGELPFPYLDVLRGEYLRGFHNIMSWSWSSFRLCLNGQILWMFLLYWFVVESHYNWEFSHAHFQSSIIVVDCSGKK